MTNYLWVGMLMLGLAGCGGSDDSGTATSKAWSRSVVEAAEIKPSASTSYEKQILDTAELMKMLMDPTYEDLKDAIENPPEKRKQWRTLYIAAFKIAELNNLLFSREDEKKEYFSSPEWIKESLKARDVAVTLGESVRNQADYAELKANYLAVMRTCNDCHREFEAGEIDEIEPPKSWAEKAAEDPDALKVQ